MIGFTFQGPAHLVVPHKIQEVRKMVVCVGACVEMTRI